MKGAVIMIEGKMDEKGLITIDRDKILLSKNKAGEIVFTQEAEEEIKKIIEFKRLADEVFEYVQDKLLEAMEKEKLQKIVAGDVVISKRMYGERYEISDMEEAGDFVRKTVNYKPDTQKIEEYMEEKGEMPDGISLKKRSQNVSIVKRSQE